MQSFIVIVNILKNKNFVANRRFTAVTAEIGDFRYLPFYLAAGR